ncbi:MAG: aminotransferase class V-fold PLP-dependent enzyme [Pyrinomonadaceae bacterium]
MSKISTSRRQFLANGMAATSALGIILGSSAPIEAASFPLQPIKPDDEAAWKAIAKNYNVTPMITNLENGYWGIMARPVLAEYQRLTEFVNRENTYFARLQYGEAYRAVREKVAAFLNVDTDEIALTRGATEALQALIGGYNKLKRGDTVLYADLDYSEMKTAMRWLEERRGVKSVKLTFPEPTKSEPLRESQILAFYDKAFDANPATKLLLLTHLNNWTGLIIPVTKIAKMAKDRGIDVILDAAHSVGHVDMKIKDLGCDFIGVNLHKWVGAPIGCGVLYINKQRIADIDSYMLKSPGSNDVTARIDTGTLNFAAHMTIPYAIDFHNKIGTAAKESRLRYLRSLWVESARKMKALTVLTPDDPKMVAALTSFRLDGVVSTKANEALMNHLKERFGVLTVRRTGPDAGDCIRVTPSVYNTPQDMAKLVAALKAITSAPYAF